MGPGWPPADPAVVEGVVVVGGAVLLDTGEMLDMMLAVGEELDMLGRLRGIIQLWTVDWSIPDSKHGSSKFKLSLSAMQLYKIHLTNTEHYFHFSNTEIFDLLDWSSTMNVIDTSLLNFLHLFTLLEQTKKLLDTK